MGLKILRIIAIPVTLLLCSCSNEDEGHTRGIPEINPQTMEVQEDVSDSEIIGTVQAKDPNGDALTFSLAADNSKLFRLSSSGEVSLLRGKSLDFETTSEHRFTVRVTDGKGEFFQFVTIAVLDVEQPPTIQGQTFEVPENILDSEIIGTVQAQGLEGDLSFTITTNDNGLFDITSEGQLSLIDGATLDFETNEVHTIVVEVNDGFNEAAKAEITIMVTDIAIVMEDQSFVADENISDTETIGNVQVEDFMGDLTFAITNNSDDLFEITEDGQLSLINGETLDFETNNEHTITIAVMDDTNESSEAEITISVTDIIEADPRDVSAFVTTWQTTSGMESIAIGVNPNLTYNYTINWGDGTVEDIANSTNPEHTYDTAGIHTVSIVGDFPKIEMYLAPNHEIKLFSIEQWGAQQWRDLSGAFFNCSNMMYNATDSPDLDRVTDLSGMFQECTSFNGDISDWDVSSVMNMSFMFHNATSFNSDISDWEVSSVTTMGAMFSGAKVFNQNLNRWDVSSVISMQRMFSSADSFNGDISDWDVRLVTNMKYMFQFADSFNGDISDWDVSLVTDMAFMFHLAESFNGNISQWNVSSVTAMRSMFSGSSFNQDISGWDVSSVTNMLSMFSYTPFDQNLGRWDIRNVQNMVAMFTDSGLSPANYDATLIGWNDNLNTPNGITLGADGINYCSNFAAAARGGLTVNKGWTITDDGQNCNP